jgi:hypothetical protein
VLRSIGENVQVLGKDRDAYDAHLRAVRTHSLPPRSTNPQNAWTQQNPWTQPHQTWTPPSADGPRVYQRAYDNKTNWDKWERAYQCASYSRALTQALVFCSARDGVPPRADSRNGSYSEFDCMYLFGAIFTMFYAIVHLPQYR